MNSKNLVNIYQEQLENVDELCTVAGRKQKAIIRNDRKLLEKDTIEEEVVLNKISRKETERSNYISKILEEQNLADKDFEQGNLNVVLKSLLEEEDFDTMSRLRNDIKNKIQKFKEINMQNKFLIEQANVIVKQTLDVLLKSRKKPILDKRI